MKRRLLIAGLAATVAWLLLHFQASSSKRPAQRYSKDPFAVSLQQSDTPSGAPMTVDPGEFAAYLNRHRDVPDSAWIVRLTPDALVYLMPHEQELLIRMTGDLPEISNSPRGISTLMPNQATVTGPADPADRPLSGEEVLP